MEEIVIISHKIFAELTSNKKITLERVMDLGKCTCTSAFGIMKKLLENGIIAESDDGIFKTIADKETFDSFRRKEGDRFEDFSKSDLKKVAQKLPKKAIAFLLFANENHGFTEDEFEGVVNKDDLKMIDQLKKCRFLIYDNGLYKCTLTHENISLLAEYIGTSMPAPWEISIKKLNEILDFGKDLEDEEYNNKIEVCIYNDTRSYLHINVSLDDTPRKALSDAIDEIEPEYLIDYFDNKDYSCLEVFQKHPGCINTELSAFELALGDNKLLPLNFFLPINVQAPEEEINRLLDLNHTLEFHCKIVLIDDFE